MSIYDAAMRYIEEGMPLIVLAGKEYGSGSSRDWAAKGTRLLGVRAVIAESFERIHRSNLVGMGVLPLQFADGESVESLGLTGREVFTIAGLAGADEIPRELTVHAGRQGVPRDRPDRHAQGAALLPPRRHPPVRAPRAARIGPPRGFWRSGHVCVSLIATVVFSRPTRTSGGPERLELAARGAASRHGPQSSALVNSLPAHAGPGTARTAADRARPFGSRDGARQVWREGCASFAQVGADHVGSSLARVPGTAGGPSLAVVGHIDEIGVHVSHIDDDGYLRFGQVGGWDAGRARRPAGDAARPRDGDVVGVIGRKPIHLLKDDDRKKVPELKELHIDIGAKDGDEAAALVRIGDVGVIDVAPVELPQRPSRVALARQPRRLLRRRRGRAAGGRGRRRARRRDRARGRAGGDDVRRRRARARSRTSPTSRSWSTSRSPPTSPASSSAR